MRIRPRLARGVLGVTMSCGLLVAGQASAAPSVAIGSVAQSTSDQFDDSQGVQYSRYSGIPMGGFDVRDAFGRTYGTVEPGKWISSDSIVNPCYVNFRTYRAINLASYILQVANTEYTTRTADRMIVYGSSNGIDYSLISDTGAGLTAAYGANSLVIQESNMNWQWAQFFRLYGYKGGTKNPRITELDGYGSWMEPSATVDTTMFNWYLNTLDSPAGEEAPGMVTNLTSSAAVNGNFKVQDAFGAKDGSSVPGEFIFADGGTADNGNGTMGDGGETVDWIQWVVTGSVRIIGYRVSCSGDSAPDATGTPYPPSRGTELVRFSVNGTVKDLWSNDAGQATTWRILQGGSVIGTTFKIEFTRTRTTGPRVTEIDAIVPPSDGTIVIFR